MMDPACEVNEKGTREKNDGNEVVEEGTDTPLDLDPNEVIEADDETLPYAEEDWQDPEQIEVPKNLETGLSQGVTWRMSLDWEVLGLTNQVKCLCPPSPSLG